MARQRLNPESTTNVSNQFITQGDCLLDLGLEYCDFTHAVSAGEHFELVPFDGLTQTVEDGERDLRQSCTDLTYIEDNSVDVVFAGNPFKHISHDELLATTCEVCRALPPSGSTHSALAWLQEL